MAQSADTGHSKDAVHCAALLAEKMELANIETLKPGRVLLFALQTAATTTCYSDGNVRLETFRISTNATQHFLNT